MTNLSVREMVLYKHGVGFFVRQGEVEGERASLTFRSDEINDILKSLAVFDQSGGHVLGIHYQTPMDKNTRLASSSVRLSNDASLRDLLRDLRGRQCELVFDADGVAETWTTVQGRIIGNDIITTDEEIVANLSILTENGIQVFPLDSLRQFRILDQQSEHDLSYFLDTSMAEDIRREVHIRLSEGKHDLVVYYVAPSPTWRVSYRLVAESDPQSIGEGVALLQGWGLFDNRLEEDLEDVRVTLVAGQPISFIYDLYASRIPPRPRIHDESRVAPGPVQYAGTSAETPDFDSMSPDELMRWMESRAIRQGAPDDTDMPDWLSEATTSGEAMAAPAFARSRSASPAPKMTQAKMAASVASTSETKDAGETFQYVVSAPVSVKRGESALVPIIGKDVKYQRELLYNHAKLPSHPVVALRFDNDSGLTLERGPVTVIEDGEYKGEAIIPFTKQDVQVYVPYAVELGIKVTEHTKGDTYLAGLRIKDAVLFEQHYYVEETTYIIENSTQKAQIVTLERQIMNGFELFDTVPPDVETAEVRRWRVEVGAHDSTEFIVKHRMLRDSRIAIERLDYNKLTVYLENEWITEAVNGKLKALIDAHASIASDRRMIATLNTKQKSLYDQQEQLRKNLGALQSTGQEATLRNRLLKQLEESQDKLDDITKATEQLEARIKQTEINIQRMLKAL